jgi:hypothetical protein
MFAADRVVSYRVAEVGETTRERGVSSEGRRREGRKKEGGELS